MKRFSPMLATSIDFSKLDAKASHLVSPKLDGVRCVISIEGVFTRSMKPLPNTTIRNELHMWAQDNLGVGHWLDGEIIVGKPTDPMCYRETVSLAMSHDKVSSNWMYYAFDLYEPNDAYNRNESLVHLSRRFSRNMQYVPQNIVSSDEVEDECKRLLAYGYEGAIIKPANAFYKCGRATPKSMQLMKYKAWADDEAVVIGYVQKEKNTNEAKVNELGNTQRSSHKSGMLAVDELGSLVVDYKGKQFNIGSGFTEEERKQLWLTRDKLIGKLVKFKYMEYGEYEVPRMPIYLGLRDKRDK